jgi:beta-glucanase (GH16 family)
MVPVSSNKQIKFVKLAQPWLCKLKPLITSLALACIALPASAGWEVQWQDQFDGTGVNWDNWTAQIQANYNNEVQCYTDDDSSENRNYDVSDGTLKIIARKQTIDCPGQNGARRSWTSGRLNSKDKSEMLYGRIESRIRFHNLEEGTWPAFWMLENRIAEDPFKGDNDNVNWPNPGAGEIDVWEWYARNPDSYITNFFNTSNCAGEVRYTYPGGRSDVRNWHNYAIEWDADEISFYIDDVQVVAQDVSSCPQYEEPMFILLNVAMGGALGGNIDPNLEKATMEVDYVAHCTASTESDDSCGVAEAFAADDDQDGVDNDFDLCLDTPSGDVVGDYGCSAEPLTIFADEINAQWPVWDSNGGTTPEVVVDDAEYGNVIEFSVQDEANTVLGFNGRDAGTSYNGTPEGTFSFDMKIISSPTDGLPWILKVEGGGDSSTGDIDIRSSLEDIDPVVGEWQTYSFDIAKMAELGLNVSSINLVMVFPSYGQGSGAVYRIDNVMFSTTAFVPETDPEPEPNPNAVPLTLFGDEANDSWPLWNCCADQDPAVVMDDADHGNVAEFTIGDNANTVQGFFSRDDGTPYDSTINGTFSFDMKIVTAPADGVPWLLKLEADFNTSDTGDINLNTSKEGLDPVAGVWQTYTFDIKTFYDLGLDISKIDVVLMFPAWGQGAGAVYRVDNVQFGIGITTEPTPLDLTLMAFDDVNADGVNDWLGYNIQGTDVSIHLLSGDDLNSLVEFTTTHSFESAMMHKLGDHNADGISEIGIFGYDMSINRYQLVAHDGQTGQTMATFNWTATVNDAQLEVLEDLTKDGIKEYAINGIHKVNGSRQLIIRNGATRESSNTFRWANPLDQTEIVIMSDVSGDGIPEVALYGRNTRIDKGQMFMRDGEDTDLAEIYNWNPLWENIQLFKMDDIDGEGTIDWGQFGMRKDDGRYQWIVKKGHDKVGVIRVFSWPADLENVIPLLVADRTDDGVSEVAITGTHKTNGKIFLRINDGKLANTRIANMSWPANWENHQVQELGDLNGDGFNEYAMLGYLKSNGTVQLVVKDGQSLAEFGRYTHMGDWDDLILSSYDVNADGNADVMIGGFNKTTETKQYTFLDGTDLEILWQR